LSAIFFFFFFFFFVYFTCIIKCLIDVLGV
jgi:hypothetical protein